MKEINLIPVSEFQNSHDADKNSRHDSTIKNVEIFLEETVIPCMKIFRKREDAACYNGVMIDVTMLLMYATASDGDIDEILFKSMVDEKLKESGYETIWQQDGEFGDAELIISWKKPTEDHNICEGELPPILP
jgi:hypothetical protein